jgi:hypothetical protein
MGVGSAHSLRPIASTSTIGNLPAISPSSSIARKAISPPRGRMPFWPLCEMPSRRIHHQTHFGLHNDPPCSRLALCFFLPHLLCAAVSPLRLCLLRRWSVSPFLFAPIWYQRAVPSLFQQRAGLVFPWSHF